MAAKRPKTKLEEFIEKLKKAKTIEEIKKITDQLYNYAYFNNNIEAYIKSAELYTALNEIEKAIQIIDFLEENGYLIPKVSLIKAKLLMKKGKTKDAFTTLKQIWQDPKVDKKSKIEAFSEYIINLVLTFKNYTKAEEEIKQFGFKNLEEFNKFIIEEVPDYLFDLMTKVYHHLEKYQKAEEFINKNNLNPILDQIKQALKKYNHTLSYSIDYDYEDPVEKLDLYININNTINNTSKEEITNLENQLIELTLDIEPEVYISVNKVQEIYAW